MNYSPMKLQFHSIHTPWIWEAPSSTDAIGNVQHCNADRSIANSLPLSCFTTSAIWCNYYQL